MRFTTACLRICISCRVPASLENPRLSRLWSCPPIVCVMRSKVCTFSYLEFCMCGTPWKKPAAVLAVLLDLSPLSNFRCVGMPRGICRRTNCKHIPLTGVNKNKQFMTKLAKPYPPKFSHLLATIHDNYQKQRVAEAFWGKSAFDGKARVCDNGSRFTAWASV